VPSVFNNCMYDVCLSDTRKDVRSHNCFNHCNVIKIT